MENGLMDYTDWLWIKFVGVLVAVFIYQFWQGLNGRK